MKKASNTPCRRLTVCTMILIVIMAAAVLTRTAGIYAATDGQVIEVDDQTSAADGQNVTADGQNDAAVDSQNAAPQITLSAPRKGSVVNVTSKRVLKWRRRYRKGSSYRYANRKEKTRPKAVTLKWSYSGADSPLFNVYISRAGSSRVLKYSTRKRSVRVYNLHGHGSYQWRVSARTSAGAVNSEPSGFRTSSYPRTIKVSGVGNVRDIGGAKTSSGKRVHEGSIYRSGNLDRITKGGRRTLKKELGIRTELDLRAEGEGRAGRRSPAKLRYINISGKPYLSALRSDRGRRALVRSVRVFSRKKNYPVIIHCMAGRDRTGTLVMVLEGLLGMKRSDIYKDYELSFLSSHSGRRSGVRSLMKDFNRSYRYLAGYKNRSRSFQYNVTHFLYDCGMSKKEIRRIKKYMLE